MVLKNQTKGINMIFSKWKENIKGLQIKCKCGLQISGIDFDIILKEYKQHYKNCKK